MKKHGFFRFTPALILILILWGCAQPAGNESPGNETPGNETPGITYTVQANGSAGTADSAALTLTFSEPVALEAGDITLTKDTGSVSAGALAGSGANWTLAISVERPGDISLALTKTGVESGGKTLTVHKAGALRFETLEALAAGLSGITGTSPASPYTVVLGPAVDITGRWGDVDTAVDVEGLYVILDLGNCAPADNTIAGAANPSGNDFNVIKTNSHITGLILPDTLTGIGDHAFRDCAYLTSVSIPAGLTAIGDGAFIRCTGLATIVLPEGLLSIGVSAFRGCTFTAIDIPAGLTSIGAKAFYECAGLTAIDIPPGITRLGEYLFYGCTSLATVTGMAGVTIIDNVVFWHCSALVNITIPPGLTSIGTGAFTDCSSFAGPVPPLPFLTVLGDGAFAYCTSLTAVTIPAAAGIVTINSTFCETGITSVIIPENINNIVNGFKDCAGLTTVVFTKAGVSINNTAFPGGASLQTLYNDSENGGAGTYTRSGETWTKSS